jgi:hypothetical protein
MTTTATHLSRLDHQRRALPGVTAAALALVAVKCSLRVVGLGRTIRLVRNQVLGKRTKKGLDHYEVGIVARRVATAAAFFPGRARCLEQAVTLYWLLGRCTAGVRFRMGVQPYGFMAHAWVDYLGEPINESEDVINKIIPFPDGAL